MVGHTFIDEPDAIMNLPPMRSSISDKRQHRLITTALAFDLSDDGERMLIAYLMDNKHTVGIVYADPS